METTYEIYPAMGIARVGTSKTDWYLGQETPQLDFVPKGGGYRTASGDLKPMGCRFRIYEMQDGVAVKEVISDGDGTTIDWLISLGNRKNRDQSLEAHNLTISGSSVHQPIELNVRNTQLHLGDLRTDEQGRLILVGSHQNSGEYSDGAGWYDTSSDGSISAIVTINGQRIRTNVAWAVVAPPDYAHPMDPIVTVYDLMENHFYDGGDPGQVLFGRDIFRILRSTVLMQWTSSVANRGHSGGRGNFLDSQLLDRLKDPNSSNNRFRKAIYDRLKPNGNMPALSSLQLTGLQLARMKKWSEGDFALERGWQPEFNAPPLDDLPIAQRPDALNRAALEPAVGGSFVPGIELGRNVTDRSNFSQPFRVRSGVVPGEFTQSLFLPWQMDIPLCRENWWPSGFPGVVLPNGASSRREWQAGAGGFPANLQTWYKLGFIKKSGEQYTEQERTLGEDEIAEIELANQLSEEEKIAYYKQQLVTRNIPHDD